MKLAQKAMEPPVTHIDCLHARAVIDVRDCRHLAAREIHPPDEVRIGAERFVEVHVSTPLEACEQCDPKGLYRKARAGELPEFTGISAPYEEPLEPALCLDTSHLMLADCLSRLLAVLRIG